ncbi:MAG: hypothetical protein ABSG89_07115 [Bacteroidales bacterium]
MNRFNSDRNVLKRTSTERFNNFDDLSIEIITKQHFEHTILFDVAVSDGRASCYFLNKAIKIIPRFTYTGSDISFRYYLYKKSQQSKSYIVLDDEGRIVEITYPPFVWNLSRLEGGFYFINNFLKKHFAKQVKLDLSHGKYNLHDIIDLLSPDYYKIITENHFSLINYNLINEFDKKYTVIRTMNILHYGYFNREQINLIMNNIFHGLEANGLLIEGSNEETGSPVEGAIWQKNETRFNLINEPENPSRIKDLVLSFKPA